MLNEIKSYIKLSTEHDVLNSDYEIKEITDQINSKRQLNDQWEFLQCYFCLAVIALDRKRPYDARRMKSNSLDKIFGMKHIMK